MKTLEKGQDKIQKICDKIRHETLEPAKQEAQNIIEEAKKQAENIIAEAEKHKKELIQEARAKIEQERHVFHSSLQQAAKQTVEALRQDVETKFFNQELSPILAKELTQSDVIAKLINGVVQAIDKEGISTDLAIVVSRSADVEAIQKLLLNQVQQKLKNQPIEIGPFQGGVQIKLIDKKMTIDLTDQALKELIANYMRKDLRQFMFGG